MPKRSSARSARHIPGGLSGQQEVIDQATTSRGAPDQLRDPETGFEARSIPGVLERRP